MIDEVKIYNTVTKEKISIGFYTKPYVLKSIDWDTPSVSMDTYRVPHQIGETLSTITVGTRKPSIIGYVVDKNTDSSKFSTWQEYYDKQKETIEQNKLELDRIVSIYQDIIIEANGYYLKARPTHPPKYSTKEDKNNEVLCLFEIECECYNPLFYSQEKIITLATVTNKFHFPLVFPPEKIIFGEIQRKQALPVVNEGDAYAGCVIKIEAQGGNVVDPKIYNVNTSEFIAFEGVTLSPGDYIIINTETGEENAYKHSAAKGENTSIVGNIKEGSKLLQIEKGETYYAYEVASQYQNNIKVSIKFTEKYFNIRGM